MASDHCPDIVYQDIVDPHLLSHELRHILSVLDAVTVRDHDDVIIPALRLLCRHVHDLVERFLPAALFPDYLKLSVIVHMYDRLDLHQSSEDRRCLRYASASVEMI